MTTTTPQPTYDPPPGPPPWTLYPPPLCLASFPSLSQQDIETLSTQGFTTFPIRQRTALHSSACALFSLSKEFFRLSESDKQQYAVRDENLQGSEEGWSRVVGEKELLTVRRSGTACPALLEAEARAVWAQAGGLMKDVMRGVEQSLGLGPGAFDDVFVPECVMPGDGEERVETLLRMFRYERLGEELESESESDSERRKGRLVAEPHRDLGLLSLVIGSSPGLEVWHNALNDWIAIEQPPHAMVSTPNSDDHALTATLLVGETLTYLTNGRYLPGRHRVFVPPCSRDHISDNNNDDAQYRYSLVFALRPHSSAVLSTPVLTSYITGPFRLPIEGVKAGDLFTKIAKSRWNINTGKKLREEQRVRLQRGPTPDDEHHDQSNQSDSKKKSIFSVFKKS